MVCTTHLTSHVTRSATDRTVGLKHGFPPVRSRNGPVVHPTLVMEKNLLLLKCRAIKVILVELP